MTDNALWRHTDEDGDQIQLLAPDDEGRYALFIPSTDSITARRVYLDRDALDDLAAIINTEPRS